MAMCVGLAGVSRAQQVLILDGTVTSPALASYEAQVVTSLGFTPVVVNDATWAGITNFSTFNNLPVAALILGDPGCTGTGTASTATVASTAAIWGPAVTGNVFLIGTDTSEHLVHSRAVIAAGIAFALDDTSGVGMYATLSCYFETAGPNTPVPMLDGLAVNGFRATGAGCADDAHLVAYHASMSGLSNDDIADWNCSLHEVFSLWPTTAGNKFEVVAIDLDPNGVFTAADGTVGRPYILARGRNLIPILGALTLAPPVSERRIGELVTLTAIATELAIPAASVPVSFAIESGPNVGPLGVALTNGAGGASVTYGGALLGTDRIQASFTDSGGAVVTSDRATVAWIPCTDFDTATFEGWTPFGLAAPGTAVLAGGIGGPGDSFARLEDAPGRSYLASPGSYRGNWTAASIRGIEFDVRVFDGGSSHAFGLVNPKLVLRSGGANPITARFVITVPMTDPNGAFPGWHHVVAPIGKAVANLILPSSQCGFWEMQKPWQTSDWSALLADVAELGLDPDFAGSVHDLEVVDFDNICLTTLEVNCPPLPPDQPGVAGCFCDGSPIGGPCGNNVALGSGCANRYGIGATLTATGMANSEFAGAPGPDTVTFIATDIPTLNFSLGLLFSGGPGSVSKPFESGLLCCSKPSHRIGMAIGNQGTMTFGFPAGRISVLDSTPMGATRCYQVWYRDSTSPCLPSASNTTNSVTIEWR